MATYLSFQRAKPEADGNSSELETAHSEKYDLKGPILDGAKRQMQTQLTPELQIRRDYVHHVHIEQNS